MSVSTNTTVLTNAGQTDAITNGNNGLKITISSFQIGSALITPAATMTGVTSLVYTGTTSQITYAANASTNQMVLYITLGETVGPFTVGNIGLFLSDGTMFSITALAIAETKTVTNTTVVPNVVGNTRIFAIPITLTNVQNIINVSSLSPAYASLPSVATEAQLPSVATAPYNAYAINALSKTNVASIAVNNGASWIQVLGVTNTTDSAVVVPNLANYLFSEGVAISWSGTTLRLWDPSTTDQFVGIVGQNDLVYQDGIFTISTGTPYTANATYYVGTGVNAGILTTTPPISANSFLAVGWGLTTSSILLNAQCSQQLYSLDAAFLSSKSLFNSINRVSVPYTCQASDYNKVIFATNGTVYLPPIGVLYDGFQILIYNTGGANVALTINTNGESVLLSSGTVNTSFTLPNAVGSPDFIWLNWSAAGPSWIVLGGSRRILNAAYLNGDFAQNFTANTFSSYSPIYTFVNSSGYFYMDTVNSAIVIPNGSGGLYAQYLNGTRAPLYAANATAGSQVVTYQQFPFSVSGNGYAALPNGLFIQWGNATPALQQTTTYNFSTAFPNSCFVILSGLGFNIPTTTNNIGVGANAISNTQFKITTASTVSGTDGIWIIAIGN